MVDRTHWGIIGTGAIAEQFATGLSLLPAGDLVAVGSRSAAAADRFADMFEIPRRHASYDALAADPRVDVVYIATPNPVHRENALLCLKAGKPVLCEKPFAINAREAEEVIRVAREERLFLMEAMWTRFVPVMTRLREMLAVELIGDLQLLAADLCIQFGFDPDDRRYAPRLGGGALLDLGVYAVSLASMLFGAPSRLSTMAHLGKTGVDEQSAMLFGHDNGKLAVLYSSLRVDSPVEATLIGTQGTIRLEPWWIKPSKLTVSVAGEELRSVEAPYEGNGYQFEATHVMDCLQAGQLESDVMPLDETLSIMRTLDQIRGQWGLAYPTE